MFSIPFPLAKEPAYAQVFLYIFSFFFILKSFISTASSKIIDLFLRLKSFFNFLEIKINFIF